MRKAEKRRIGREKQEQNLRQVLASGWEAQKQDQDARDRRHQEALIARDSKTKSQETANGPKSKIAQEKQNRVVRRLNEKNAEYELNMRLIDGLSQVEQEDRAERLLKAIFMGAGGPISEVDHDAELDLEDAALTSDLYTDRPV